MHFLTRFILRYLTITLAIIVALIVANLTLQGREIVEQDSPHDCRDFYLGNPRNQKCTTMWGTCTAQKNECVKEGEVDLCRFGWEKTYVLFGERYCVTAERSAYNQIQVYKLKWPFALLLSIAILKWWLQFVMRRYAALNKQIDSMPTPKDRY